MPTFSDLGIPSRLLLRAGKARYVLLYEAWLLSESSSIRS